MFFPLFVLLYAFVVAINPAANPWKKALKDLFNTLLGN